MDINQFRNLEINKICKFTYANAPKPKSEKNTWVIYYRCSHIKWIRCITFLDETARIKFVTNIDTQHLNQSAQRSFAWDFMAVKYRNGNYLS